MTPAPPNSPARRWGPALALILLATVPFLGGIDGAFVEDDFAIIRDNPDLRADGELWRTFTRNYWRDQGQGGLYRPLTVGSYGVDRWIWGAEPTVGAPRPGGIHGTNLLLNALATLLVYSLFRSWLGCEGMGAWMGAAIFAVHPVHTEAVVHLVGRADLLTTVCVLGAFVLHLRATAVTRAAAAILYLAALLSKEMGAVLPGLLLLHAAVTRPQGQTFGPFVVTQIRALWPYVLALAVALVIRGLVLGSTLDPPQAFALYVPGQFIAFENPLPGEVTYTMTHVLGEYLWLLVAPVGLSADYSGFPHHTSFGGPVLVSALVFAGGGVLAGWAARKGRPEPALGFFWIVLSLLPVSNFVVVTGILMAERVLYLPSVGIAFLAGWGSQLLARRDRRLLGVPLLVIALFAAGTALRSPVWKDPRTLYEDTVENGRYRGHIALTGLAGVYLHALRADSSQSETLLLPALEAARASVAQHTNLDNLEYLARLAELADLPGESLENWEHLRRAVPSKAHYQQGVERLCARVVQSPDRNDQLARAADVGRTSLVGLAVQKKDATSFVLWDGRTRGILRAWIDTRILDAPDGQAQLEQAVEVAYAGFRASLEHRGTPGPWDEEIRRLFHIWIVGGLDRGLALFAAKGCLTLEKIQPESPILGRYRLPAYHAAVAELLERGQKAAARPLAEKLRAVDPENPLATEVLGPRN